MIPDKIWLILHDGLSIQSADWSIEKINPDDIGYIRAPQWTRVEDGFPEDRETCFVFGERFGSKNQHAVATYVDGAWIANISWFTVTHWMPLPAPPEDA